MVVNSIIILLGAVGILWAGYVFYGRAVEKFFGIEPDRPTPAHECYDGVDYVPARHWIVLFGHHFASIAGAGPIVGPVIAVAIWGWWPALIWVVLGTVFLGGVHDFLSIIVSVRHKGRSIADIAEDAISRRAKFIFLGFVWLALVLVIAVFTVLCAKTLTAEPKIAVPSFGLIGIAVLVGVMLYVKNMNTAFVTVLGLALLLASIFIGERLPINLGANANIIWTLVLLIYAYIASVAPVQVLLQPRDYLSSFLLYFGIIAGILGIFVTHPAVNIAGYEGWKGEAADPLWPMLFVTVACGAISGFHALVASGTTSKQLPSEVHARKIGYGGMALEAVTSVVALLAVSAGLGSGVLKAMLSMGGPGPISAFGEGYNFITKPLLFGKGSIVAIMILNAFILTTLDTATRIARYLSEELFRIRNRFIATFVVVLASGVLALTGKWNTIWPVFGASNQLVAALTFVVISSWLICRGKSLKFTFIPAVFMLATAIAAFFYQLIGFIKSKSFVLSGISLALIVLSCLMVFDVVVTISRKRKT